MPQLKFPTRTSCCFPVGLTHYGSHTGLRDRACSGARRRATDHFSGWCVGGNFARKKKATRRGSGSMRGRPAKEGPGERYLWFFTSRRPVPVFPQRPGPGSMYLDGGVVINTTGSCGCNQSEKKPSKDLPHQEERPLIHQGRLPIADRAYRMAVGVRRNLRQLPYNYERAPS